MNKNRELIISCGTVLEYPCVSARYFGFLPQISYDNEEFDQLLIIELK